MNEIETLPKNNTKKYTVLVVIVLALIGYGIWRAYQPAQELVKTADLQLGAEQQEQREGLVDSIQDQLAAAEAGNASVEERFKLYSQLGNEQYAIGAYDEARKALLSAQKLLPENPTSYQDLYAVYSAMHDYTAAREVIKKAVELNSASIANWTNYIALEKNQFGVSTSERLKLYEQAVVKTANAPEIVHAYAQTYEEKGDYVQAYTMYRGLVEQYPNNLEYHADLDRLVSKQDSGK